ncbi:MAG: hypothetical protein O3A00_03825 [Planctomycetota bacterium]|nr:hypothetical protein [Planctomycetota bacterium]
MAQLKPDPPNGPYYETVGEEKGLKVVIHFDEQQSATRLIEFNVHGGSVGGTVKVNARIDDKPPKQGFEITYASTRDSVRISSVKLADGTTLRKY